MPPEYLVGSVPLSALPWNPLNGGDILPCLAPTAARHPARPVASPAPTRVPLAIIAAMQGGTARIQLRVRM